MFTAEYPNPFDPLLTASHNFVDYAGAEDCIQRAVNLLEKHQIEYYTSHLRILEEGKVVAKLTPFGKIKKVT